MEGLKMIPYIALIITIAGVILGASVLTLGKFGTSITSKCYNSSYTYNSATNGCYNNTQSMTDEGNSNLSAQMYSVVETQSGLSDVSEQQPTIAIIAVMVIIISIIAGVFVYMRYFS